jgi:hypothetical protein
VNIIMIEDEVHFVSMAVVARRVAVLERKDVFGSVFFGLDLFAIRS